MSYCQKVHIAIGEEELHLLWQYLLSNDGLKAYKALCRDYFSVSLTPQIVNKEDSSRLLQKRTAWPCL